jgi:monoamine oxidase
VETDVLIVGAGMAGLTAARALLERGVRVLVVEARDRVDGRVLSIGGEGGIVELGAEFVHGRAPELWALIDECGCTTTEREGVMLREVWDGGLAEADGDETMFEPLEELESFAGEDVAFADWLKGSDVPRKDWPALLGYVQGFNAADAQRIGVRSLGAQQKAEDAIESGRSWHVRGGYAQLAEYLAAQVNELGGVVRLGCAVTALQWSEGAVEVATSSGAVRAQRCIVTLPLGVLQRVNDGGVRMQPEPAAIAQAKRLAMGHAVRFTMEFRERWWERSAVLEREKLESMSFLMTPRRMPPVWWTARKEAEALPTLTGWVGGPGALALQGKSAEELGSEACATLAEVFATDQEEVRASLVATYTHDWTADRWSLGAYSYVPAGAMGAPQAMTEPEQGTLFFAGEHTDTTGHWGTVHAAMRSGLRAAGQVLETIAAAEV